MLNIRVLLGLKEPRSHMVILGAVLYAFGLTMLWQPGRYFNTPSYANLLQLLRPEWWGSIHVLVASLMVVSIIWHKNTRLIFVSHGMCLLLVAFWWVAFIVRYFTDDGTTIVNVCSWGVFVYLIVRSGLLMMSHIRAED